MVQGNIGGFHEHDANGVIAEWLNNSGRSWQANSERTSTLIGSNERPDIIIRQGDRMPVIVECEYGRPAVVDAIRKLNHTLNGLRTSTRPPCPCFPQKKRRNLPPTPQAAGLYLRNTSKPGPRTPSGSTWQRGGPSPNGAAHMGKPPCQPPKTR